MIIGKAYGIKVVTLRYFNVYGPRQSLNSPYASVCAIFTSKIKNNRQPLIFEDDKQTRDFISVHDVVQTNILAMENSNTDYEVFNVGTGKPTSILEVVNILINLYGRKDLKPKITNRYRIGDIRHCYAGISKIRGKLGFKPRISFVNGMRELMK